MMENPVSDKMSVQRGSTAARWRTTLVFVALMLTGQGLADEGYIKFVGQLTPENVEDVTVEVKGAAMPSGATM